MWRRTCRKDETKDIPAAQMTTNWDDVLCILRPTELRTVSTRKVTSKADRMELQPEVLASKDSARGDPANQGKWKLRVDLPD